MLEHIPDPKSILGELSEMLAGGGQIIVEVPNANDSLLTLYNNSPFSHFTYWSCHLFLYTAKTLQMLIELLKYHSHPAEQKTREIYEIGISHIAFTVDDLDFEYERLKDKGIQFNSPPQLSLDGYAKVTFCRVPEGTLIELVEVL